MSTGTSTGAYEDVTFTFAEGVNTITINSGERCEIAGFTFLYA